MTQRTEALLFFRVDANDRIGMGHFMRCLALAQAWKDAGGRAAFLTACDFEPLLSRIHGEGFGVHRLPASPTDRRELDRTLDVLEGARGAWTVLDGYGFDPSYHRAISEAGHPLLIIDDNAHLSAYYVDAVLNQNAHAHSLHYVVRPSTRLLLGTPYVLLRREFLRRRVERPTPRVARRVLVTLGGGGSRTATIKVLEALRGLREKGMEVTVVLGPGERREGKADFGLEGVRSVSALTDPAVMPDLMVWADLAISGAGSTMWELAFMGVPSIVTVLAENQERAAAAWAARGVVRNLGNFTEIAAGAIARHVRELARAPGTRARMAAAGRAGVDGLGVKRVVKTLQALGR